MKEEYLSIKTPFEFISLLEDIKTIDNLLLTIIRDTFCINLNVIYNPDYEVSLINKQRKIIEDYFNNLILKGKIYGRSEDFRTLIENGCYSIIEILIKYNYSYMLDNVFTIEKIDYSGILFCIYNN